MDLDLTMTATVQRGTLIVHIGGSLDAHTERTAWEALRRAISQHRATRLVISLVGVYFMDSRGLTVLQSIRDYAKIGVYHGERSRQVCELSGVNFPEATAEEQEFLDRVPLSVAA